MLIAKIATVVQWCSDVEASKAWYTRLLGLPVTPYEGPYFRFDEGCYLILAPASAGTGRGGTGVWFEVADVEAAYREKLAGGFAFNEPPFAIPPGKLVTLNDPDGNIIGLIDNSNGGMPSR